MLRACCGRENLAVKLHLDDSVLSPPSLSISRAVRPVERMHFCSFLFSRLLLPISQIPQHIFSLPFCFSALLFLVALALAPPCSLLFALCSLLLALCSLLFPFFLFPLAFLPFQYRLHLVADSTHFAISSSRCFLPFLPSSCPPRTRSSSQVQPDTLSCSLCPTHSTDWPLEQPASPCHPPAGAVHPELLSESILRNTLVAFIPPLLSPSLSEPSSSSSSRPPRPSRSPRPPRPRRPRLVVLVVLAVLALLPRRRPLPTATHHTLPPRRPADAHYNNTRPDSATFTAL